MRRKNHRWRSRKLEKRERYKRLIMFLASTIILAAQTGVFAYSWFVYYGQKEVIRRDYYFWGNVVAIGQYALILLLFYKVFGAFKVGYLRIMDVLLSQVISLLCTNAFIYLEMNLIAMWKFGEHLALCLPSRRWIF